MESIESLGQKAFLKSVHPFDLLKDDELDYVLKSLDMLYFQKDEAILTEGEKAKELYIIMKGRVREIESETEVNYFEERESFDASSLLSQVNKKTYIAVEETICYALPGKVFLEFINSNNSFESYYLLTIKEKLNNLIHRNVNKEMASFMIQRVKDCMIQPAIVVDKSYSILDAVRIMTNHKMSSILVDSGDPKKPGIVTDTDLREKVILANLSYSEAVEQIATYDLISISVNDFLFNAMILMIEHSVKRLIVYDGGNVRGILEQTDVLGTMSHKSHLVDQRIKKANSLKELKIVHDDLVLLIKSLISTGVKVRYIVKLLAELDLKLYKKLYHLLAPQELIENSCFIVLGSEGRKEQILKTDQDNAIILRDGYNPVK
ncbi:MAG: DUF294 nucleotidyltransferase-like domain-containing protein, partial [Spirochaetota bacterium]|nr:DUF294 nucleotidyltransferase-like domain-containing protein [Spirochaetota bacterium]